jgi:hypothetical protein
MVFQDKNKQIHNTNEKEVECWRGGGEGEKFVRIRLPSDFWTGMSFVKE